MKNNSRTKQAESTRKKIIKIATYEFSQNGYSGARVDVIASKAKVNKQVIYYHFGSKEKLFMKVLEYNYACLRNYQDGIQIDKNSTIESITKLVEATFNYYLEHPEIVNLLASENLMKAIHVKQSDLIADMYPSLIQRIQALLNKGVEQGIFRPNVNAVNLYITIAALANIYISNHYSLSIVFKEDLSGPDKIEDWRKHMVDVIISYLKYMEE